MSAQLYELSVRRRPQQGKGGKYYSPGKGPSRQTAQAARYDRGHDRQLSSFPSSPETWPIYILFPAHHPPGHRSGGQAQLAFLVKTEWNRQQRHPSWRGFFIHSFGFPRPSADNLGDILPAGKWRHGRRTPPQERRSNDKTVCCGRQRIACT